MGSGVGLGREDGDNAVHREGARRGVLGAEVGGGRRLTLPEALRLPEEEEADSQGESRQLSPLLARTRTSGQVPITHTSGQSTGCRWGAGGATPGSGICPSPPTPFSAVCFSFLITWVTLKSACIFMARIKREIGRWHQTFAEQVRRECEATFSLPLKEGGGPGDSRSARALASVSRGDGEGRPAAGRS